MRAINSAASPGPATVSLVTISLRTSGNSAAASSATRSDGDTIASYLNANLGDLDVDGDGSAEALTDGLLLLRYLFGFDGPTLIEGAVGENAVRTSATDIKAYIEARISEGT